MLRLLDIRLAIFFLFVLGYGWGVPASMAQAAQNWPSLEPSYVNYFYQEDQSYSKKCYEYAFRDAQGMLWLAPCGVDLLINSTSLFRFDGYQFEPVEVLTEAGKVMESPFVNHIDSQGRMFWLYRDSLIYIMDPDLRVARPILPRDPSFTDVWMLSTDLFDGEIYALGLTHDDQMVLFSYSDGAWIADESMDAPEPGWTPGWGSFTTWVSERDIWLLPENPPLWRFDREERAWYTYTLSEQALAPEKLFSGQVFTPSTLVEQADGRSYLFFSTEEKNRLYQYDAARDQLLSIGEDFPEDWQPLGIFPDEVGNLCFLFRDGAGENRAILETADGQRFDLSLAVAGKGEINRLAAEDFRTQIFILTTAGFYTVGIREPGLIDQAMPDKWVSSMGELPDGRILVNTIGPDGWRVFDPATGQDIPFQGPDCGALRPVFGRGMKQQIMPDTAGHLWFLSYNSLVRYDPRTNSCETFELKSNSSLFAFLRPDLVVYQGQRNALSFLDLNSGQHRSFEGIPEQMGAFVRDLLMDSRGLLWIPTNEGLVKIEIQRKTYEILGLEQGFADFRFTTIYQDSRRRLWIGTYFGGIHIYEPETGQITVVNRDMGLSDNAIMGIMEDEQGDMWVSTEYGVNLLSPEGEVLGSFHREDGLTYEIFDRFDPFKSSDGRIYFGSRNGASIIDPEAFKAYLQRDSKAQLYLTELGYYDKKQGAEVIRKNGFQNLETIEIPPERPYLHLSFALSSYLEPQKNSYAYMLEGIDEDWQYLGTQSELQINRLPPGKYRILIRGADFRKNWSTTPLAIDIHARQFFYKQAWFYLLASLPFVAFGLIWARNKQLEARRLEREVAQRTQKIREDKALIEKQAAELRQLDQLKSQFFTNISHELRTPITLIRAPLENLLQKQGGSLRDSVRGSLELILRNAGKLGNLVEELLELSGLEAKKVTLKETATPLAGFCRRLFSAYGSGAALKRINYQFHTDLPEAAHFLVDRNRLEKVLNNLLSNALKFTPEGGSIRMSLRSVGEQLQIEVADTGRGIPPEDLPHIFDRYFQTRRKEIATEGGTGIGLALSKELALLMGGNLLVESEWEKGARFSLWLPAKGTSPASAETSPAKSDQSAVEDSVTPVAAAVPVPAGAGRPKILVVEDNPDMQQLIVTLLADTYDCVIANDGAEAWAWLQAEDQGVDDIQLIMSDVMMPKMDGYALLEEIKGHPRWQRLPVIMLTARSAEEDKLQALRMGVDDYLLKPFSPAELDARLANLIRNYQARKSLVAEAEQGPEKVRIEFAEEQGADQVWLKEVEDAAREALEKGVKLTTGFLADKVFLSERQFHRKIKTVTGLTPNGYILEVKLQKARHLLENKVYSTVSEVAAACGFSTGSYLTRVYHQHFGKKPGEYI